MDLLRMPIHRDVVQVYCSPQHSYLSIICIIASNQGQAKDE